MIKSIAGVIVIGLNKDNWESRFMNDATTVVAKCLEKKQTRTTTTTTKSETIIENSRKQQMKFSVLSKNENTDN